MAIRWLRLAFHTYGLDMEVCTMPQSETRKSLPAPIARRSGANAGHRPSRIFARFPLYPFLGPFVYTQNGAHKWPAFAHSDYVCAALCLALLLALLIVKAKMKEIGVSI